jgi:hypothetical protein
MTTALAHVLRLGLLLGGLGCCAVAVLGVNVMVTQPGRWLEVLLAGVLVLILTSLGGLLLLLWGHT